jgi:hypothetical protein
MGWQWTLKIPKKVTRQATGKIKKPQVVCTCGLIATFAA